MLPALINCVRNTVAKELAIAPAGVVGSATTGRTSYSSQTDGEPLLSCSVSALDRKALMAAVVPTRLTWLALPAAPSPTEASATHAILPSTGVCVDVVGVSRSVSDTCASAAA